MTARNVFCEALVCGQMVALAIFAITVNCQAAIFDDAKLWYRDFSDRNANGKVDAGEIRDCLHAGNATDVRNQSDKLGYGDLGFSVEDVLCQYSQKTLTGVSCLELPQETDKQTILDTGLKSSATDFTAFIRFKRGSLYDSSKPCYLMNIAYGVSNGGLLVGFEKDYGCLLVHSRGKSGIIYKDNVVNSNITFGQNTWMEMAVVVQGMQMTIYARKKNYQNIRYDIALSQTISPDPDKTIMIGGENAASTCFRGKVHQFAFWERALTQEEVYQAFSSTGVMSIDLWQAGSKVVGAYPFCGASSAVDLGDTSATWTNGSHWASIPAVWTPGTSITTQFEVPQYFGGINQAVAVVANAGSGRARVFVDGVAIGTCRVRAADWGVCSIPGSLMTLGKHTLRIEQDSGTFVPQFISVGGSWQLGESYADKAQESAAPADYYVDTKDLKKLRYANSTGADGTRCAVAIHFTHDRPWGEGWYDFSFSCFGSNPKSDAVNLYVNDVLKRTYVAADWTGAKTVKIDYAELATGDNVITFENADSSHAGTKTYMGCHWYRLEETVRLPPSGTTVIFR